MISWETIQKIQSIFMHLQIGGRDSIQFYDTADEYRRYITIGKGLKINSSAKEVYCHTDKLTAWHRKIWDKKKGSIPHIAFCEWMEEGKVWRIGYK